MIKNLEKKILSKEELWNFQKFINNLGPRLTGTASHKKYIDFIENELRNYGLEVFHDEYKFNKWEAKDCKLTIEENNETIEEVKTTSYYPYSGQTSKDGVSGELIYCGKKKCDFKNAKGKIAIVEVNIPSMPSSVIFKKRNSYPKEVKLPALITNPVIGSVLKGPNLKKASEEGVLGVICIWRKLSYDNAVKQYLPFTVDYQGCPAIWVDGETGDRLKKIARTKVSANIILDAKVESSALSKSIYAVLPGSNTKETIIVNTHTDGPNACEENGGIGLLALAHYFSKFSFSERNRTIIFVFATGHFQLPQFGVNNRQATSRWLQEHREFWDGKGNNKKAVAAVTIEHLGCTEWKDDKKHLTYSKTNPIDLELVYTGNNVMNDIYIKALEGRNKVRTITLRPRNNIYFGEGQPLFQEGIPTISLVPAPDYLCKISLNGDIDKLDAEIMYEQIQTFLKVITEIDTIPAEILGKPQKQSYGILG